MDVMSMKELKNVSKIDKICHDTNGPIFLEKNGACHLVVMSFDFFEKIMRMSLEAKAINDGLSDIEKGKTIDGQIVIEEMKEKYKF